MVDIKFFGRCLAALTAAIFCVALMAGCSSTPPKWPDPNGSTNGGPTAIRAGQTLQITYSDVDPPIAPALEQVKEDGSITLMHSQKFTVVNRGVGDVQEEIHKRYVPRFYTHMTVTVKIMDQWYTVSGEVRSPGRQSYPGDRMTVLRAIATAGGFTEFANKSGVIILRTDGKSVTVDAMKAIYDPAQDLEIYPGDVIHVRTRYF